ncbi:MAG: DUF86 domain-containing protein [Candidatus Paceibacterota bacterium]
MKRTQGIYILDIFEAIKNVEKFMQNIEWDDFDKNIEKQSAVFRQLEIIGEAASCISLATREKYADVPWRQICAFRNKIIHEYFGINAKRVWNIIKDDLPVLKNQISNILGLIDNK